MRSGPRRDGRRIEVDSRRPQFLYVLLFAAICIAPEIFLQYTRYVSVLKWLTLFLFAYVACLFMVKVPWSEAARSLVIPSLRWDKDYLTTVVAVLGTTISPYLFFWQASQEAEDVRTVPARQILKRAPQQGEGALNRIHFDTFVGMGFSNFIALAIMVTAAATLHANNVTDIQTSAQGGESICLGRHRHRLVVRPGPRRIGGIRRRRSAEMADRPGPPADGSQGLLRGHLHCDHCRHDHELHSDQSDPGLVLERRDQRRGGRPSHGGHDVARAVSA